LADTNLIFTDHVRPGSQHRSQGAHGACRRAGVAAMPGFCNMAKPELRQNDGWPMQISPLYTASVPVFRHYLGRISDISDHAGQAALQARIADSFPAGRQFTTAAGYALRIACPLAGRAVPDLPQALAPRLAVARATLGAMHPEEFDGAEDRMIPHRAGEATLEQSGADFLYLYGIPNFFFHLTMGYAALRAAGVPLGKADFDGQHIYPPDFAFPED
jgi:uncharacterized protein